MDTERACLVIADISGYTEYLAGVELDHAQDVLADLISTVVKSYRPRFKLSKLEGDAAFVYSQAASVDGSILMDTIEGSYFAFRQRLLSIRQASTCECQACILIPNLDLKVVAHHGEVVIQKMAGRSELVGTDVVVVHRLLKNSIDNPAYAFFTDATISATGLDPRALEMSRHTETYDHLGEVGGWIHDLTRQWVAMRERKRVYVAATEAVLSYSAFYPVVPEVLWEYISSPVLRAQWNAGLDRIDQLDPSGRRRPGTVNHCMHGGDVIIQEFLDWRPPRYYTSQGTFPDATQIVGTAEVEAAEGGAILHERYRPSAGGDAAALEAFGPMFAEAHVYERERLTALLEEEAADSADDETEPETPVPDEAHRLGTAVRS